MVTLFYNIPSAMDGDRWIHFPYYMNNEKYAARRAVIQHFRGSVMPDEVEIHLRRSRGKRSKNPVIKRYLVKTAVDDEASCIRLDSPTPIQKTMGA